MIKRAKTIHKVNYRDMDLIKRLQTSENQVMVTRPNTKDIEKGDHLLINYTDSETKQRLSIVRVIEEVGEIYIWIRKIQKP
jgi:hypothetical protein